MTFLLSFVKYKNDRINQSENVTTLEIVSCIIIDGYERNNEP